MEQPNKENVNSIWLPQVGQKFRNLGDAWSFWVNYGSRAGFEVRKRYGNKSKGDKKVTSCRYVCAKEGKRVQDKRDHLTKNPRAETRTCCPVQMGLTLDRVTGDYELTELMLVHNHGLYFVRVDGDLSFEQERIVVGDPLEQTASCNCGQFKRTGVLCGHALKVLDLMNIKLLPNHYILKRWTREARFGTIQDNKGRSIIEYPKLDAMLQYKDMSHRFF